MTDQDRDERTPLGFRVLVSAAALYLFVRLVQGVAWVIDRLR